MIFQFKNEYRWLSNFYPCELSFRGKRYPSVEYAYMSAKSEDKEWKMMCADATEKQSKIKKKSQHLELVPDWAFIKIEVMRECLNLKFSQEPFKTWLIETGDIHLQEGNTWGDKFWGVDLETGEGENLLGRLIMMIRADLQDRSPKPCSFTSNKMADYFHNVFDIRLPDSFTINSMLFANVRNGREIMQCTQGCSKYCCKNEFDQSTILYLPIGKQHGFPMKTSEMREFWEQDIKRYYAIGFHASGMNNNDFYYIRIDEWRKVYIRLLTSGVYSTFQKEETARFIEKFSKFEEQLNGLVDYFEVQQVKGNGKYKVTFGDTTIEESMAGLTDNVFERLLNRIIN